MREQEERIRKEKEELAIKQALELKQKKALQNAVIIGQTPSSIQANEDESSDDDELDGGIKEETTKLNKK